MSSCQFTLFSGLARIGRIAHTGRISRAITLVSTCATLLAVPLAAEPAVKAVSTMNWTTEQINSEITLDTAKSGITLPTGRNAAIQMLEMETPSLLKDTFFSVVVDSSMKLGNAVEQGLVTLSDLNLILDAGKKTPPWFSRDLKTISLSHTVSVAKVGSLFIKHRFAYAPDMPLDEVPTRAFTGIIIDARGILPVHGEYTSERLVPALFPKIWNQEMDLLYEKNMVDPAVALSRGIVRYTSSLDETTYRDRIGTDPLRITARGVFGNNRTDPVITRNDYLKILSSEANRKLLLEGKLVILCNPEVLESGALGPNKNDNYYFVWTEINKQLEKQSVSRIDFADAWDGLKLTIYNIRFVADSAEILPEEAGRLNMIAAALKAAGPSARFQIDGHTASVGKPGGEQELSLLRAQKIAAELTTRGIRSDRINAAGFGGTLPIADNDTDDGRARNRRVEITIHLSD